jgi:hypothetical protein
MGNIEGAGIHQGDLVTLLTLMATKFNTLLTQLDADTLGDSNYSSTLAITFPSTRIQQNGIRCDGDVLDYLITWRTAFNSLLTKLDADGTVTDTNYSSLWAISTTAYPTSGLQYNGEYQSALVRALNTAVTNYNSVLTKLDADGGVPLTTYVANCAVPDTVIEYGTSLTPGYLG